MVVTATVAAVGLAFFTYGFPVIGSCLEIGLPQILVVLIFSLVNLAVYFLLRISEEPEVNCITANSVISDN